MLHRGCFYSLKNIKETIWLLTQMTMEVYTQIVQICCSSLAKAKTWQSPLLTEQHDNSPRHKEVPSSLPRRTNVLSLPGDSKISAARNNLSASQECRYCVMYITKTFPKRLFKYSSTSGGRCIIPF